MNLNIVLFCLSAYIAFCAIGVVRILDMADEEPKPTQQAAE